MLGKGAMFIGRNRVLAGWGQRYMLNQLQVVLAACC